MSKPRLCNEERRRLDDLIGLALLDKQIREQLLHKRDSSWLTTFGLSKETRAWLVEIQAGSLTDLAQAILPYMDYGTEPWAADQTPVAVAEHPPG